MNVKKNQRKMAKIKFGSTTIITPRPTSSEMEHNIIEGQRALVRARDAIITPGVKLNFPKGVPLYHAHPTKLGFFIRELNGKSESGVVENGQFIVVK